MTYAHYAYAEVTYAYWACKALGLGAASVVDWDRADETREWCEKRLRVPDLIRHRKLLQQTLRRFNVPHFGGGRGSGSGKRMVGGKTRGERGMPGDLARVVEEEVGPGEALLRVVVHPVVQLLQGDVAERRDDAAPGWRVTRKASV